MPQTISCATANYHESRGYNKRGLEGIASGYPAAMNEQPASEMLRQRRRACLRSLDFRQHSGNSIVCGVKLRLMRYVASFGIAALIVFLALAQPGSSKLGTPVAVRNRDTIQRLYGSPVSETYRTSQKLRIIASFASSGDLCRATISSDRDAGITDTQLNPVLSELVPEDVRGKHKIDTFLNVTC